MNEYTVIDTEDNEYEDDGIGNYRYSIDSNIKDIEVKNFKCIGDVKISFEESPIISLIGNSDVGKTSIIHAIAVLIYNAYSQHQKRWIKTGRKGFGVRIQLDDGTVITRIKGDNTDIYDMSNGNQQYSCDKLDTTTAVPTVIKDKLGCMIEKETREFVNIRTYKDQLLFVTTAASTTYKVIYSALNVEYISKSIKLASKEINAIKDRDRSNQIIINNILDKLKRFKVTDTEALEIIKDRIKARKEKVSKLSEVCNILNRLRDIESEIDRYKDIENLDEINVGRFESVKSVNDMYNNVKKDLSDLNSAEVIDKLSLIDTDNYVKIRETFEKCAKLSELQHKIDEISEVESIENFNDRISRYTKIYGTVKMFDAIETFNAENKKLSGIDELNLNTYDIINNLNSTISMIKELKNNINEHNKIVKDVREMNAELIRTGVKVGSCPKCGTDIYI